MKLKVKKIIGGGGGRLKEEGKRKRKEQLQLPTLHSGLELVEAAPTKRKVGCGMFQLPESLSTFLEQPVWLVLGVCLSRVDCGCST